MTAILEAQANADDPQEYSICTFCNKQSMRIYWHHEPYRSQGNAAPKGEVPLCRECHQHLHSERGDFAVWGGIGGKHTGANPANYKRNLKQYRVNTESTVTTDLCDELTF